MSLSMTVQPEAILQQSVDKQRIVVTEPGEEPPTAILIYVLNYYKRSSIFISAPVHGITETSRMSDAPHSY